MSGNEIYFSMFLSIFIFNSVFNSRNSDNRMIIHDDSFYDILLIKEKIENVFLPVFHVTRIIIDLLMKL